MKNWRTTLAGIAAAALQLYTQGASWKNVGLASAIMALGWLAGDSKNTQDAIPGK